MCACMQTPRFSPGFAGHPEGSWRILTPFHCKRCKIGDLPCPWELLPHQKRGVCKGGHSFPSAQRHCRGIVTLPCSFCMVSALSGCSLPLPKGKENFCRDHEYFFLLGQLLHLFSQGLRQQSDSKVHGACERRGPRSPPREGHGGQDQQKRRKIESS